MMAWYRSGDKPLSEPMMVSLPTHICVTPPQWVKWTRKWHSIACPWGQAMECHLRVHLILNLSLPFASQTSYGVSFRSILEKNYCVINWSTFKLTSWLHCARLTSPLHQNTVYDKAPSTASQFNRTLSFTATAEKFAGLGGTENRTKQYFTFESHVNCIKGKILRAYIYIL